MRIVGGKYKGRVLNEFKGNDIRPTSDMVRESLFNILQFRIYGKAFLDLCAGTGAMGIEALSRGAGKVIFNDSAKKSLELLKGNLKKLNVSEQYNVLNFDAVTLLKNGGEYDFIFIDPPYKSDVKQRVLEVAHLALAPDGLVILEDEKPWETELDNLQVIDRRKYGRVHLTFFEKSSEKED